MKKVLSIVLNNFTHDSRVLKECLSLNKAGYDISVLALHDDSVGLKEYEAVSGIQVHRIRLVSKSWSKMFIVQLIKYIEFIIRAQYACCKADILHCNDLNALIVGVVAKVLSLGRVKIIYDAHELECEASARNMFGKKTLELLEGLAIPFTNKIITVSPSIAEDYARRYGIAQPSLVLNAPAWREEVPHKDIFRRKYGIKPEQKIFIYQGVLSFERSARELVEAFAAREKDDAVLIFMGYGPAESYIRDVAAKYDNIFLHPAVPFNEVLQYSRSADYGLIIYHTMDNKNAYYCLPNKFFEYSTCGLPILASDLRDIGRINEKYHLGHFIKTLSVEDINTGIDRLLADDYDKLSQGAKMMAKQHCWEQQEKELLNIYAEVATLRSEV